MKKLEEGGAKCLVPEYILACLTGEASASERKYIYNPNKYR